MNSRKLVQRARSFGIIATKGCPQEWHVYRANANAKVTVLSDWLTSSSLFFFISLSSSPRERRGRVLFKSDGPIATVSRLTNFSISTLCCFQFGVEKKVTKSLCCSKKYSLYTPTRGKGQFNVFLLAYRRGVYNDILISLPESCGPRVPPSFLTKS